MIIPTLEKNGELEIEAVKTVISNVERQKEGKKRLYYNENENYIDVPIEFASVKTDQIAIIKMKGSLLKGENKGTIYTNSNGENIIEMDFKKDYTIGVKNLNNSTTFFYKEVSDYLKGNFKLIKINFKKNIITAMICISLPIALYYQLNTKIVNESNLSFVMGLLLTLFKFGLGFLLLSVEFIGLIFLFLTVRDIFTILFIRKRAINAKEFVEISKSIKYYIVEELKIN